MTLSDGTIDTADLLLGCDGIHSSVRRLLRRPAPVPTGIAGLGSIIPTSTLSDSTASCIHGMNVTMTQEGMFFAMTCTAPDDAVDWAFSK